MSEAGGGNRVVERVERSGSAPEHGESLWLLTWSPAIWALHFLCCYLTGAIWCAKVAGSDGSLDGVRVAFLVYTVIALAGIGLVLWRGLRRRGDDGRAPLAPSLDDTPVARRQFLGLATVLLSGLSAVATVYTALAALFVETCR